MPCGGHPNQQAMFGEDVSRRQCPFSPKSQPPSSALSQPQSLQVLVLPESLGPRESNGGPFAVPNQLQSFPHSSPAPHHSRAANVEAGSPSSPKPSKIPLLPPAPLHALPQLVLCNEGKGKKKTKGREGEGATSAVGSQDEQCGWGRGGDCRGYN